MTTKVPKILIVKLIFIVLLFSGSAVSTAAEPNDQTCTNLAVLNMTNVTIDVAEVVGASEFSPPSYHR